MSTTTVELSDISVRFGGYELFLTHVGHADPRYPWHITPHAHSLYEVHCVSMGHGVLYTPTERIEMSAGTTCLTGPGVCHGQTSGLDDPMDEYCLRFTIESSPVPGADRDESKLVEALIASPFFLTREEIGCQALTKSILDESLSRLPGYRKRMLCLFGEFIVTLGRSVSGIGSAMNEYKEQALTLGELDLKARLDYYFFFYDRPLQIDEIISELHITRRHFSRLMQKYYGMSYTEKIDELRVGYAKQLLAGGMSVAAVADSVGYGSAQQFIKKFRLATGMTPGEFRQTLDSGSDG